MGSALWQEWKATAAAASCVHADLPYIVSRAHARHEATRQQRQQQQRDMFNRKDNLEEPEERAGTGSGSRDCLSQCHSPVSPGAAAVRAIEPIVTVSGRQ